MNAAAFTEAQLKNAVALYSQALRTEEPSDVPDPEFSAAFKNRMRENSAQAAVMAAQKRRAARRRILRTAAAVIAVFVIALASAFAFSAPARAAVLRWYTEVRDKVLRIRFTHSEDDHAFIICTPGELPEGFVCDETRRIGDYCLKQYKNAETGDYIRFEYLRPSEKQKAGIEKTGQNAEQYLVFDYYKMYLTGSPGAYKLCWYDSDRDLAFYAESNMDKDALVRTFSTVDFRLPLYEPTWLPAGYMEYDRYDDYPGIDIFYSLYDNRHLLYSVSEMYSTDLVYISKGLGKDSDDVISEKILINGMDGYYYPPTEHSISSDLVIIDSKNGLVCLLSGPVSRAEIIRMAKSIRCLEPDW